MAVRILVGIIAALRATLIFGEVSSAHDWQPSLPRLRRPRLPHPSVPGELQPAE